MFFRQIRLAGLLVSISCFTPLFADETPRPEAAKKDGPIYALPYEPGEAFLVGQGYFEFPTHENTYAIDWEMPEETPILAVAAGDVVAVVDSFSKSGLTEDMKSKVNYIVIRHEDGTRSHYYHLAQNGAKVKLGQKVKQGEQIALSGNTGFSSTPHLHFFVDRLKNGNWVTFPALYKSDAEPFDIVRGGKYLAPGGEPKQDEGPLADVKGTGELTSIRPRLIAIVKAANTPNQAAVDLKKHLLANRKEYKRIYKETFAKSQKGDMDLQSQPEIARLLIDPTSAGTTNEAMLVWWELFAM
jgi:hypothetical protein